MGHYECKKCGQYYDDCECGKAPAVATNTTAAVFERRGSAELAPLPRPWRKGDESKQQGSPSARGSVTVRRPDGTTITCDVAQLQEVLEQVHKVRPRTVEVTCTSPATTASGIDGQVLGFGPGIGEE